METWRLLDTGCLDGATNMAIDEALLIMQARGHTPPTLRFYGWRPSCLSVGVFQSVRNEVKLDECRSRGVDVVRRPTGGRAILHADEVTYSLVADANHPFVRGSISESYRRISNSLAAGLRSLGVSVQLAPKLSGGGNQHRDEKVAGSKWSRTPACFDTPSDYELVVDGRKLVGSAQVRKRGMVLQHGSIMLGVDVAEMFGMLRTNGDNPDQSLAQSLHRRMIGLKEALGREVHYGEVTEAIVRGFQDTASLWLAAGDLTEEERTLARQLREEKYLSDQWNLRR